jgi:hypothetical protein
MTTIRIAMLAAAAVWASGCYEVEPLAIDGTHYGQTYAQWGASWWQWAFSLPATDHPVLDETGDHCGAGQEEPVWFLAGTFGGGPVQRSCTIPEDQALLFPIVNLAMVDPSLTTDEQFEAAFDSMLATASDLHATFDGESLGDPAEFRVGTERFSFTVPSSDALFGIVDADGIIDPAYSDGYYMMLDPLPPGEYELAFGGVVGFDPATADDDMTVDVTYTLTVE